jgi:hypothetical protein
MDRERSLPSTAATVDEPDPTSNVTDQQPVNDDAPQKEYALTVLLLALLIWLLDYNLSLYGLDNDGLVRVQALTTNLAPIRNNMLAITACWLVYLYELYLMGLACESVVRAILWLWNHPFCAITLAAMVLVVFRMIDPGSAPVTPEDHGREGLNYDANDEASNDERSDADHNNDNGPRHDNDDESDSGYGTGSDAASESVHWILDDEHAIGSMSGSLGYSDAIPEEEIARIRARQDQHDALSDDPQRLYDSNNGVTAHDRWPEMVNLNTDSDDSEVDTGIDHEDAGDSESDAFPGNGAPETERKRKLADDEDIEEGSVRKKSRHNENKPNLSAQHLEPLYGNEDHSTIAEISAGHDNDGLDSPHTSEEVFHPVVVPRLRTRCHCRTCIVRRQHGCRALHHRRRYNPEARAAPPSHALASGEGDGVRFSSIIPASFTPFAAPARPPTSTFMEAAGSYDLEQLFDGDEHTQPNIFDHIGSMVGLYEHPLTVEEMGRFLEVCREAEANRLEGHWASFWRRFVQPVWIWVRRAVSGCMSPEKPEVGDVETGQ